ncbi:hypothetical protein RCO48_28225 [Peribacillus frigoritolerans]|nr:hypothetical protein [Peribacillus frigoritolerans]
MSAGNDWRIAESKTGKSMGNRIYFGMQVIGIHNNYRLGIHWIIFFPDRPALMFHAEGHYAWVNTKALEIANITRHSENPFYGIIGKDEMENPMVFYMKKQWMRLSAMHLIFSNSQKMNSSPISWHTQQA